MKARFQSMGWGMRSGLSEPLTMRWDSPMFSSGTAQQPSPLAAPHEAFTGMVFIRSMFTRTVHLLVAGWEWSLLASTSWCPSRASPRLPGL